MNLLSSFLILAIYISSKNNFPPQPSPSVSLSVIVWKISKGIFPEATRAELNSIQCVTERKTRNSEPNDKAVTGYSA